MADEFFVALRLGPSGGVRVLLSDVTAADEFPIARQALGLAGPGQARRPDQQVVLAPGHVDR